MTNSLHVCPPYFQRVIPLTLISLVISCICPESYFSSSPLELYYSTMNCDHITKFLWVLRTLAMHSRRGLREPLMIANCSEMNQTWLELAGVGEQTYIRRQCQNQTFLIGYLFSAEGRGLHCTCWPKAGTWFLKVRSGRWPDLPFEGGWWLCVQPHAPSSSHDGWGYWSSQKLCRWSEQHCLGELSCNREREKEKLGPEDEEVGQGQYTM